MRDVISIDNVDFEAVRNHLRLRKELALCKNPKRKEYFPIYIVCMWLTELGVIEKINCSSNHIWQNYPEVKCIFDILIEVNIIKYKGEEWQNLFYIL